jgi:hypothetical protein
MQFKTQGTAWAFAHDMRHIMVLNTDDATQNRIVFIEMTERYLIGEKYEAAKQPSCVHRGDTGS